MGTKRVTRRILRNKEELYKETLRQRGRKHIDHYSTPTLYHPTADDIANIEIVSHIWKTGDRYSKLAYKFYGDVTLWWVIAWFNQLPTESHIELGDVIQIPTPLDKVLGALRK